MQTGDETTAAAGARLMERKQGHGSGEDGKLKVKSDKYRVKPMMINSDLFKKFRNGWNSKWDISEKIKFNEWTIKWNILESTELKDWGIPLLYNMIKEFVAVIAFFMCNSRIGASDPNATPLILFGTLVVFAFPHMNPYLFTFMRTGPWLSRNLSCGYIFTVTMQIIGMTIAQCIGAIAAAAFRNNLSQTYGSESIFTSTGYVSLRLNKNCENDKTKKISLFPPYFTEQIGTMGNNNTCFNDLDNISRIWWTFEELFGVAAFLIGTIHIMEALMPGLLINTFWSQPTKPPQEEHANKVNTAASEEPSSHTDNKNNSNVGSEIDYTVDDTTTTTTSMSDETADEKRPYAGIPIQFIAVESMLFAAAQKAFPTSHLALQVTVYLAMLEHLDTENEGIYLHKSETPFRILGGVLGTFIAWLYHLFVQKHPHAFPGFIKTVTSTFHLGSRATAEGFNRTPNLAITFRKKNHDDIKLNVKHLQQHSSKNNNKILYNQQQQ